MGISWPDNGAALGRLLSGVRVLDLSRVLAGPYCTMVLGDLGADVIKVESPAGDETRRWGPPFAGDTATYYFGTNRNKVSVVLDLMTDYGRETLAALIREADVFVHNFTPSVAAKLGADYASVRAERDDIVHLSFSGFGADDARRGYDLVAQAMSGLMAITGETDGDAVKVGAPVSDLSSALFGAVGVVSALVARARTGAGAELHVSLYDATLALLANQSMSWLLAGEETPRLGSEHPSISPYGAYRAADGQVVIAVGTDQQFAALCAVLDRPDLGEAFPRNADRIANRATLKQELERALAIRTRAEWIEAFEQAGVPTAEVRTVGEALTARDTSTVATVADQDGQAVAQVLGPLRVDGELQTPYLAPPRLGQDTDAVLGEG